MNQEIRYTENGNYLIGSVFTDPINKIQKEAEDLSIPFPESLIHTFSDIPQMAFIYTVFVKDEDRGLKIGKKLVNRFCWEAELMGAEKVVLFADLNIEQNKGFKLLNFYKKQGFKHLETVNNYAFMTYNV